MKSVSSRALGLQPGILTYILFIALLMGAACSERSGKKSLGPEVLENPATAGDPQGNSTGQARISFDKDEHNFGKVIQGEVISYSFRVSNEGEGPLVIADVTSTCGCTVGEYPKQPLQPGEEGFIRVTFDSKGRQGFQSKVVTVVANTQPSNHPLRVIADVVLPEMN